MMRKLAIAIVCIPLLMTAAPAASSSYTTGFETSEGYTVDETLYQQNGWDGGDWTDTEWNKIDPDEAVVGTVAHSGSNSWYFPGKSTTEGAGTPFSPRLDGSIGAPAHADYNWSETTLWFKPKDAAGDDSGVNIYQAATDLSDRTGFNIYIESSSDGIDIGTYRWAGGTYSWEQIATGVAADQWHSIDVEALFKDDFLNDEITYIVDKGTANQITSTTGNTWTHPWFDANQDTYKPGNGLKFAWSRNAPDTAQGFYFDDVSYSARSTAAPVPEPAGLGLLGLTLLGIRRRRRS